MKSKLRINKLHLPLVIALGTAGAMAGTETAAAETPAITTPDWLKVSGYAALSYTYTDVNSDSGDYDNDTFFNAVDIPRELN